MITCKARQGLSEGKAESPADPLTKDPPADSPKNPCAASLDPKAVSQCSHNTRSCGEWASAAPHKSSLKGSCLSLYLLPLLTPS